MDSLTHAFSISALLVATGNIGLIPFAALGAVIPDIDIFLGLFSKEIPKYYLFIHGGITHSIIGALTLGILLSLLYILVLLTAVIHYISIQTSLTFIFAFFVGTLSHILLDYLAYPGIPLFAPISPKKHTLGVLPGPHPVFLFVSLIATFLIIENVNIFQIMGFYSSFFLLFLFFFFILKIYVGFTSDGESIPSFNPLRWTIIKETQNDYLVSVRSLGSGISPLVTVSKRKQVSLAEERELKKIPEIKRLIYNSYIVSFEKEEDDFVIYDPLRLNGHFYYPQNYKSVRIKKEDH